MQNVHHWPQEKPTFDDDGQKLWRPAIFIKVYNAMTQFYISTIHTKFPSSLADEGLIKPVLGKVLPFTADSLAEGFNLLKSRRAVGKIVFDMNI